jgi:formiminoglutamase
MPPDLEQCLNHVGRQRLDTDWHVDRLYKDLLPAATIVRANFHRYVIDANRDPSGESLYPGQFSTELVPSSTFDGEPIWKQRLSDAEMSSRRAYHDYYHAALQVEIERVQSYHGIAVVYDCHSIRSSIPQLFDGTLSDLNIGDNNGATCAPQITAAVAQVCRGVSDYTSVINGRFRGGWTTRKHGRPDRGVHAIQMEISQSAYLETEHPPFSYDTAKAQRLRVVLRSVLARVEDAAHELSDVRKHG